jgi:hypothetical protein
MTSHPLQPCEVILGRCCLGTWSKSSPDTESHSALMLDVPVSTTRQNKFLFVCATYFVIFCYNIPKRQRQDIRSCLLVWYSPCPLHYWCVCNACRDLRIIPKWLTRPSYDAAKIPKRPNLCKSSWNDLSFLKPSSAFSNPHQKFPLHTNYYKSYN